MKAAASAARGVGAAWRTRERAIPAQTFSTAVTLDLSAYKSSGSQVRFSFDSMDAFARSHPGWAVDDVVVQTGGTTATSTPTNSPTNTPSATNTPTPAMTPTATRTP